jgi:hypothetical protein
MNRIQRTVMTVAILLNLLGFGIMFLVLANGEDVEDVVFFARSDVTFLTVIAVAGVVANLVLVYVLIKVGLNRRRHLLESDVTRPPRITGD